MDTPASIFQDDTAESKPNPASIGAPAAIARSLVLQSLALWYRTPIKVLYRKVANEKTQKSSNKYTLLMYESFLDHSGSTTWLWLGLFYHLRQITDFLFNRQVLV